SVRLGVWHGLDAVPAHAAFGQDRPVTLAPGREFPGRHGQGLFDRRTVFRMHPLKEQPGVAAQVLGRQFKHAMDRVVDERNLAASVRTQSRLVDQTRDPGRNLAHKLGLLGRGIQGQLFSRDVLHDA
ncbi:hypothetical protein RZS08_41980, partial [Arthrospira platensis SPKY1]|nr:hypothetical protein [Arthrospira platensis SPKY1]